MRFCGCSSVFSAAGVKSPYRRALGLYDSKHEGKASPWHNQGLLTVAVCSGARLAPLLSCFLEPPVDPEAGTNDARLFSKP